jgi:hypothetical protein
MCFTPGTHSQLPEIIGELAPRADFNIAPDAIAAAIALFQASPSCTDLSRAMILEDLGFRNPGYQANSGLGVLVSPIAGLRPR